MSASFDEAARHALEVFGLDDQLITLTEELGEAVNAIASLARKRRARARRACSGLSSPRDLGETEHMCRELTDVALMLRQVEFALPEIWARCQKLSAARCRQAVEREMHERGLEYPEFARMHAEALALNGQGEPSPVPDEGFDT